MSHEGRCVLPADAAGQVLDRLTGLQQFITPQQVQQALHQAGRRSRRDCVLTMEILLWVVLARGILTDLPWRQVFQHARRLRQGEKTPRRGAWCRARQRLGVAPLR